MGGWKAQPASTIEVNRSASGVQAGARAPGRRIEWIRMVEATRNGVPAPGVMR